MKQYLSIHLNLTEGQKCRGVFRLDRSLSVFFVANFLKGPFQISGSSPLLNLSPPLVCDTTGRH